eukprot:1136516-Pelagomonas_calceolata.AAC.3
MSQDSITKQIQTHDLAGILCFEWFKREGNRLISFRIQEAKNNSTSTCMQPCVSATWDGQNVYLVQAGTCVKCLLSSPEVR